MAKLSIVLTILTDDKQELSVVLGDGDMSKVAEMFRVVADAVERRYGKGTPDPLHAGHPDRFVGRS